MGRFVFKDQYIELSNNVPEDADLYGLGEVTLPTGLRLPRDGRTITLFNSDMANFVPDVNLYGSHPFYLQVNKSKALTARLAGHPARPHFFMPCTIGMATAALAPHALPSCLWVTHALAPLT